MLRSSSIAVPLGGTPNMKCLSVYWSFFGLSSQCYLMNQWQNEVIITWTLRLNNRNFAEDLMPVLEQFSVASTFWDVSISSVFAIVHSLLDHLEAREVPSSDSKVIRDFKDTIVTQFIDRRSLYSAHPMLMGSQLDPRFKHITPSKYKQGRI